MAFPKGLPPTTDRVHPTQLYEAAILAVLCVLLLRWRRCGVSDHVVLGRYLLIAGAVRFLIEFIRVNERVIAGLTVAHMAAVLMMLAGMALMATAPRTSAVNLRVTGRDEPHDPEPLRHRQRHHPRRNRPAPPARPARCR